MSQFVYFYRGWAAPASPAEMQQQVQKWSAWFASLSDNGHLKDRGFPLARTGKVVKGANRAVTDGPYVEAKDFVGGYSIVEAADLAQAVKLSKGCPNFELGGFVEVRPLLTMSA